MLRWVAGAQLIARASRALIWLAGLGAVAWLYTWMATGGTYRFESASVPYYDLLSEAFLAGQLHLLVEPLPALLALPDPYDPKLNHALRLPDASLFNQRYYLYFGPVPGLLHAGWKLLTGTRAEESAVILAGCLAGSLGFFLLVRRLRARAFPELSAHWATVAAAWYALGGVGLYLAARTIGHHEAIIVGSAFVLWGLYCWLRGLEGGRWSIWYLILAGVLLGCAFGSRHTLLGYALACSVVMIWRWLRASATPRAAVPMVAFGIGPGIAGGLHLLYNAARFGSPFDFGVNYALTGDLGLGIATKLLGVLSLDNIERNLHAYFVRSPAFIPYFPFHITQGGGAAGWMLEAPFLPVSLVAPVALLAPFSLVLLTRYWRQPDEPTQWLVLGALGGLVIPGAVTIFQVAAIARYLQDTLPVAVLLGTLGIWWLLSVTIVSTVGRLLARAVAVGALVVSISMGVTLGMAELAYDKTDAYLTLAYRFDRAFTRVAQVVAPTTWRSSYASAVQARAVGPFLTEAEPYELAVLPGSALQSLTVASVHAQPSRLLMEVQGKRVFDDVIYPGTQVVLLNERIDLGPSAVVPIQLQLPEAPALRPGDLQPLSVSSPSSQPSYSIARSYRLLLEQLRRDVEEARRRAEQAEADLALARADVNRGPGPSNAGSSPAQADTQRKALEQRVVDAESTLRITMDELHRSEARLRVEQEYLAAKDARVEAAARR